MKQALILLLFATLGFSQAYNGGSPGPLTIPFSYGDDSTDATTVINNALAAATNSKTVYIDSGTYRFSTMTIPDGVKLICSSKSTVLKYTGSTTAINMGGGGEIIGCFITRATVGGTAILVNTVGSHLWIHDNVITNFTTGIKLDGGSPLANGDYFLEVSGNWLDQCTTGITTANSGGATVNSVTIRDNTIHHTNKGISICSGCIGNLLLRNDIEFPTGASGHLMDILGNANILIANWIELNSIGTATAVTGLFVSGTNNTIIANSLPDATAAQYTVTNIDNNNFVLNPYDFTSGAASPDIRMPGLWQFFGAITGASSAPAVDASSCTGATIGTGATNLAGTITGLPTGSCVVKLTFSSATSAHGWNCAVSDKTTGNLFRETATTTTTATFSGTSVSGDVLAYGPCVGY